MDTYIKATLEILDVLPIATLYGLFGFALYAVIVIAYPVYLTYYTTCRRFYKGKHKVADKRIPVGKLRQWISKKTNTGVILLYGEENERLREFLENESTYGICEMRDTWKRIQIAWLAMMLRINALSLILLSMVFLWDVFVLDRTIECEEDTYCYIASNELDWHRTPFENCSDITEDDLIVCFRFVYNIDDAAAKAGGILMFGKYAVQFGSRIVVSFLRQFRKCCHRSVYRVFVIVVQQLPVTLLLIIAVLSMVFVRYRDLAYYGSFVQAYGVASIYTLVIATPWCVLVPDQKSKTKGDQTDSDNNTEHECQFSLAPSDPELEWKKEPEREQEVDEKKIELDTF